jgi:transcription initiation factor TFIIB
MLKRSASIQGVYYFLKITRAMHTLVLDTCSLLKSDQIYQIQPPSFELNSLAEFAFNPKLRGDLGVMNKKQKNKSSMQLKRKFETNLPNDRSYKRNLRRAFQILKIVKYKLLLPDEAIEKSANYYQRTLDGNIIKGRSIGAFAVASAYIACRELGIPRQLREIAEVVDVHPIIANKCYRMLLRHLDLNLPFIDVEVYLSKIAKDLLVNKKTYQKSLEILEAVRQNVISYGKEPNALASAVLYVACLKEGEKIIQSRFSKAGNISIVTLRKRTADVVKVIS